MNTRRFGTLPDGRDVHAHTLQLPGGPVAEVLDLGAAINSLHLDPNDPASEVMVGFATLEQQQAAASAYFGAIVGRYANRIADGCFDLDGTQHQLTTNEGPTTLHGGTDGFNARTWRVVDRAEDRITLELTSPDGDEGFPGELTATVTYRVLPDGLRLEMSATTNAATVCCLSSHAYLNLAGGEPISDEVLALAAERYLPIDDRSIPLGRLADVAGTPFDFTAGRRIGDVVSAADEQVSLVRGVDHSFDLNGEGMRMVATLDDPRTGRHLTLWTDQPALQVYTGNFLDGSLVRADGRALSQYSAIALEPQAHPDSPNQDLGTPVVLRPGERWSSQVEWRFSRLA